MKIEDRLYYWAVDWVELIETVIRILSFGFIYPRWSMWLYINYLRKGIE